MKNLLKIVKNSRGDTIVEVLIAIAVAAFAISTSYALANQSLQHAINAHERNEALNIIENQIADLKARYKGTFFSDPATFNTNFTVGSATGAYPLAVKHFCLRDNASDPKAPNWLPFDNSITAAAPADNLAAKPSGPYNDTGGNACIRHTSTTGTTDYYIDIVAEVTASSANALNRTVYEVNVRWSPAGGGANQHAVIYYRLPGKAVPPVTPPAPGGGGSEPPCTPTETVSIAHGANAQYLYTNGTTQYPPLRMSTPLKICGLSTTYVLSVVAWDTGHPADFADKNRPDQPHEQVFIEGYNNNDSTPVFTTGLTQDIAPQAINSPTATFEENIRKQVDYLIIKHISIHPNFRILTRDENPKTSDSVHGVDVTVSVKP